MHAWRARADEGAALITVILLLVALTAMAGTVAVVSTNDWVSAGRDRQGLSALATADAGVSQALTYIRGNGVGQLTCLEGQHDPPTGDCATTTQPWANPVAPREVRLDGTAGGCTVGVGCYEVWISAVERYDPPLVKTGTYRIRSTGFFGGGPGAKSVVVDVSVTPAEFPIGVFGNQLDGNGNTQIYNESLFTTDCVSPRHSGSGNGTRFQGIDPYWDQPAAANSTTHISTSTNCGGNGYIHRSNVCATGSGNALVNDRDSQGGPVGPGSPCYHTYQRADGSWYPDDDTTLFTFEDLEEYGFRPGGLSDAQYDALRTQAQALGTYNIAEADVEARINAAVAAGITNPVLYFEGRDVSLRRTHIPAIFGRTPSGTCTAPYSVTIVVRHGNLVYQGGTSDWRSLAVFVPEGSFTGNGGYNILGTLFANNISLGGNERWELDNCWIDNMPGPLMDLTTLNFREEDRSDIN
jgi:hypothetical protein